MIARGGRSLSETAAPLPSPCPYQPAPPWARQRRLPGGDEQVLRLPGHGRGDKSPRQRVLVLTADRCCHTSRTARGSRDGKQPTTTSRASVVVLASWWVPGEAISYWAVPGGKGSGGIGARRALGDQERVGPQVAARTEPALAQFPGVDADRPASHSRIAQSAIR